MRTVLGRKKDASMHEPMECLVTPRQRDILRLISLGNTSCEIGMMLQISARTVEVHRYNLMHKLNVRNVAQLLTRALQLELLPRSVGGMDLLTKQTV